MSMVPSLTQVVIKSDLILCVLLQALMVEPVIAADGHTYEKAAIESWLQHNTTSPVNGNFLAHAHVVPNVLIRTLIRNSGN